MNIGYVFDLSGLLTEDFSNIPFLKGLCIDYASYESKDLTIKEFITCRDRMLIKYVNENIEKHVIFFVLNNSDIEKLKKLASCIAAIQREQMFDQQHYEIHILFNFINDDGFGIATYEKNMPVLTDNSNCVYTWLLGKYDDNGGKPITPERRTNAMWRLIGMLTNHRENIALLQMTPKRQPIYYLFGNASLFFDEDQRNLDVRHYYNYKNLQHLLNLSDAKIEEFMQDHVWPLMNTPKEMEKRIEAKAENFLKEQRVPIEASIINDVTQNLLIKSSQDDEEYLVDVKDDSLVFIDDLSHKQEWKMPNTDTFLQEYNKAVENGEKPQGLITKNFLDELDDKIRAHRRIIENEINTEISDSRKAQVKTFKSHIDKHLLEFLNKHDNSNYNILEETLVESEVANHGSNLDYSIAFLEYLADGKSDYLIDQEVAVGDINLEKIRRHTNEVKEKYAKDVKEKEEAIAEKNRPGADGEPSQLNEAFNKRDQRIEKLTEEIQRLNYQIEKWWDSDAKKKLTVKSRSILSIIIGAVLAFAWLLLSIKQITPLFNDPEDWEKTQWSIFALLIIAGILIALAFIWSHLRNKKNKEKELEKAKRDKKSLMFSCMKEKKELVELRYSDKLAFHALKTVNELIEVSKQKKKDLESYRKALFKLMLNYKISLENRKQNSASKNDFNTIELKDLDPARILFGPDNNNGREIRYCFAQGGVELSETFEHFRNRKALFETTRFNFDYVPAKDFDKEAISNEVIAARKKDEGDGIEYTELPQLSVLPTVEGVEMDDIHQGSCGDCYFMATLASIARLNPDFIIGDRGLVEELDEKEHKFFRVRFFDKDGNRVNVDINNKFWNRNGTPYYAGKGNSHDSEGNTYDPWVMAVEKAWAKANNAGYDGIEGASADGIERQRKVEYSFAVTGKSAYYCMTKNVPNSVKLAEMIKEHFNNKKPITLYSASPDDEYFSNKDQFLVANHAYALSAVNDDGTFDIFNPWNSHPEGERGQHYVKKNISFIKDNFDVVVFFDIKESDFDSFEKDLTENVQQKELTIGIEKLLTERFDAQLLSEMNIGDLLNDDILKRMCIYSSYLFNTTLLTDKRDIHGGEHHRYYVEGTRDHAHDNQIVVDYVNGSGEGRVEILLNRDDDKQSITLLKVSPQYVLSNFGKNEKDQNVEK